ncbi:homoserine dehydrogenase [Sellimonas sp.]|uniref:homoserine dehydrogenase n=1 Tax=Sellimonas sp. TaxID=2021466 RepID=UPI000B37815E|nr:homoserine dehydrogenase [Sellimonas sp.]OUP03095.1 homoserine dehydrogenase [Drancourtella sp. An210]OUP65514.1 homoserine dehydrogenase [Drancourtella sp. An177]
MVNVAVLGYGTVGSGVVEVFRLNQSRIDKCAGTEVRLKYVLDLRDFPGDPVQDIIIHDFEKIVGDEEVDVVVEVMGGIEPAYTFVKRCLEAGKNVVTSNKALVAAHGSELLELAQKKNVNYLFEASVGGGIPIIRPLNTSLTGDEIEEITGILNGTTNYMMTKMFYEGADYDAVLKEAQANGFAERNPEADVEGYDACRKIAILTSIVSGQQVDFEDIYTEGITNITKEDMKYAREMGMVIKLLAMMKRDGEKVEAIVAPFLLPLEHPLASVNGVFNAIFVHGNALGDAMFYGSGAGKMPTASAVVADIVDAAKNRHKNLSRYWTGQKLTLADRMEVKRRYFVRMSGCREDMQASVEESFGHVDYVTVEGLDGEFGFTTDVLTEGKMKTASSKFDNIIHMLRMDE